MPFLWLIDSVFLVWFMASWIFTPTAFLSSGSNSTQGRLQSVYRAVYRSKMRSSCSSILRVASRVKMVLFSYVFVSG